MKRGAALLSMVFLAAIPALAEKASNKKSIDLKIPATTREAKSPKPEAKSITQNGDCTMCHTTDAWRNKNQKSLRNAKGGFDHSKTGFPLSGRHQYVDCTGCHAAKKTVKKACVSCHQDPHQARLGRFCESCHSARAWSDTKPIEMHRRTRFPLTGMHALVDCTQCHQRRVEREFSAPPSDCYACHENDYRKPGLSPNHVGAAGETPFPRDCSICHRAAGWRPARRDMVPARTAALRLSSQLANPLDHDRWFVLSFGPHQNAPCATCHLSENTPRALNCTGCHAHNPVLIQQQHKNGPVPTQGAACMSCHIGGMAR